MKDSRLGNNISQYASGTSCPDGRESGAPTGSIRFSFVTLPAAAPSREPAEDFALVVLKELNAIRAAVRTAPVRHADLLCGALADYVENYLAEM